MWVGAAWEVEGKLEGDAEDGTWVGSKAYGWACLLEVCVAGAGAGVCARGGRVVGGGGVVN